MNIYLIYKRKIIGNNIVAYDIIINNDTVKLTNFIKDKFEIKKTRDKIKDKMKKGTEII